jgi:membrane associated rhomboid family serine protease
VEDAFGPVHYLVFYFGGGFVAMMMQTAMTLWFGAAASAHVPELGASGAIAAVLGPYFILYPGSRVLTYIFPIFLVKIRLVLEGREPVAQRRLVVAQA